mmetsp:Transcript_68780/g.108414  ORF Transcript_68780/g.108414 Transcript_68780/m.108414 type:complete len:298 (+) Transcript_68780:60-953(+)
MVFNLEVSNTFLHCKVDEDSDAESDVASPSPSRGFQRRLRSHSSPPDHGRASQTVAFFDHDVSDDEMKIYASDLSHRAGKRSFTHEATSPGGSSETTLNGYVPHLSPTSPESPPNHEAFGLPAEVAEAALVEAVQPKLPSCGSLGHPEVCRRPCIYFMQGNCENGDACVYCHLPHPEKTPKLDKRQRTIVQGLERRELLALIFSFCKAKAETLGFSSEAEEILQLLEEESMGAKPLSDFISERDIRNLQKTLARMNFSNLICLVTHQSPNRAGLFPESAERLSSALERLRPRLGDLP